MAALIRQRGHSLVELLVATLIVGVGAMGSAKLHMLSAQNNRAALEHSLATMLAEDMLERIRANPLGAYGTALGIPPPAFVDCLASACSPSELAAFDMAAWKCSLGRWRQEASCARGRALGALPDADRQIALPEGDGGIEPNTAGGVTVVVAWGTSRLAIDGVR